MSSRAPSNEEGSEWPEKRRAVRRAPNGWSTSSSQENAKHPEGCQMIGKPPSHRRTPAARRALGNLTLGDKEQAVTR